MINLKHYLSTDHNKAVRLNDYFEYYSALANFELAKGNYDNAEKYMRYATKFIDDLRRLNSDKRVRDTVNELTDYMLQKRRNYF